jgi:hypothetical protein
MFVVQFEYEIVGEGFVESCEGFGKLSEARDFGHNVIDELFDELGEGVEIDDATVRVWYTGGGETTETLEKEED